MMRAILVVLIVIVGIQSGQAQTDPDQGQWRTDQQQQPSQTLPVPVPIVIIEDESTTHTRERRETEATQREIEDLLAQQGMNVATQAMNEATQRMADYAWWSMVFVGIGTFLLTATLFLTGQANRAAIRVVEETKRIGDAQIRAYVHIHDAELRWNGRKMQTPEILLYAKNDGATPAKWFEIRCRCFVREYESRATAFSMLEDAKRTRWNSLGSKESLNAPFYSEDDAVAIKEAHRLRETHILEVVGDVTYRTFFNETFISEFYFVGTGLRGYDGEIVKTEEVPMPDDGWGKLARETGRTTMTRTHWREKPVKLSRGPAQLRTYEKVDDYSDNYQASRDADSISQV